VFCGAWQHSHAAGYVPRNRSKGEKWTHWKVLVVRERYSDCAILTVDIRLFEARKRKGGGWSSRKRAQIEHTVNLGNINNRETRDRLLTDDGYGPERNNPKVIAELQKVVETIEQYANEDDRAGRLIETVRLTRFVEAACLREKIPVKQAA